MRSAAVPHQRNQSLKSVKLLEMPFQLSISFPLSLSSKHQAIQHPTVTWKFGQKKRAQNDHKNLFSYLQSNKQSRQQLIDKIFSNKDH
jgi:hypothetical protein